MEALRHSLIDTLIEWGIATYTLPSQTESGDRPIVCPLNSGALIGAVDGLGHGRDAAAAADLAVDTLTENAEQSLIALFKLCHAQLRETRGVVMSLALINAVDSAMTWMGVGNVEGVILRAAATAGPRLESLLLRGGVVGDQLPPLYASIVPITRGDTVIFATDGIQRSFVDSLTPHDSSQQLADRILAHHSKGSDDALVLVARFKG